MAGYSQAIYPSPITWGPRPQVTHPKVLGLSVIVAAVLYKKPYFAKHKQMAAIVLTVGVSYSFGICNLAVVARRYIEGR